MKREPDDSAVRLTRKSLADTIDGYDNEITALQTSKRETFDAYREQLASLGKDRVKAEIEAVKSAIRRRRAIGKTSEAAVEAKDALADEVFTEITARAPRATYARASSVPDPSTAARKDVHQHLARRGEVTSDGTQLNTDHGDENPQGGNVVPDTRQPAAGTQAPPVDTPSQLEETQRQGESEQRRDNGSQSIQSLHLEAAVPAVNADLDGGTSLAGAEGEADRQPHSEPEVHTSWLKSTPLEGQLRSKAGLPRMPGCANIDACAGMWNRRCYTCEREWKITHADAPTEAA